MDRHDSCLEYAKASLNLLKKNGYKYTKARKAIANAIANLSGEIGPKDVFEKIKSSDDVNIDFATVCRNFPTFVECAVLHQIPGSGKFLACSKVKDIGSAIHAIYRCESCRSIHEEVLERDQSSILLELGQNRSKNFKARALVIDIAGQCSKCANLDDRCKH